MGLELFAAAARGENVAPPALTAELDRAVEQLLSEKRADPGNIKHIVSLRNMAFGLPGFFRHGANISSAAQRLVAESGDAEIKDIVFTLPLGDRAL